MSERKIYEKDGAMWLEAYGFTVCAVDEDWDQLNPLSVEYTWVAVRLRDGAIATGSSYIKGLLALNGLPPMDDPVDYANVLRQEMKRLESKPQHTEIYEGDLSALEPIREWSKDLIDRKAVVVWDGCDSKEYAVVPGQIVRIAVKHSSGIWIENPNDGEPITWLYYKHLALLPEEPIIENQDQLDHLFGAGTPLAMSCRCSLAPIREVEEAPKTETTHTARFKFPNGDEVEIPPPDGEGWEQEIIFDEWTERDPDTWCPGISNILVDETPRGAIDVDGGGIGGEYSITHINGLIVAIEYQIRVDETGPDLLSLTKWTRPINFGKPIILSEENYTELCISETGDREATLASWPERRPSGPVKVQK